MKFIRWLIVTFSMYSKIPMPRFKWKDDDMSHSLTFFPVVGAVIGAVVYLLNSSFMAAHLSVAVRIILSVLIPLIITGGFHVDGFMDTEDAINSYASREKKIDILKDSHVGAFAIISLLKWYLAYAAALTALFINDKCDKRIIFILGMTFVLSRSLSGLTSVLLKKAKKDGMLYEETKAGRKGTVISLLIQLITACIIILYVNYIYGTAVILVNILYTIYYRYRAYKEFGGVTGDTAGFFLTTLEIISAVTLALAVSVLSRWG